MAGLTMLPVAWSSQDLLVDRAGAPVWPAQDGAEAALRQLAATFGCSLSPCDAVAGTAAAEGDEIVLGLGRHNAGNVALYAHLTRRHPRIVGALDELADLGGVAVLICQWRDLSFAMLDRIHRHGLSRPPIGLIVGHDPAAMRDQLLTRAAAAWLPGAQQISASLIFADWPGTEQTIGRIHLLGAQAGAGLAAALARGASVVSVNGHGDGLDMQLGTRETLCGVIGRDFDATEAAIPDCVSGRYCYRVRQPLPEALAGGLLVDPRQLQCRVAIFSSCFTIPARGALVGPSWSLLGRWLDSARVGAVLAPFGLSAISLGSRIALTQAVLFQANVGAALQRFNRGADVRAGRLRMCLFGDPRTAVPCEPLPDDGDDAVSDPVAPPRRAAADDLTPQQIRCGVLLAVLDAARRSAPGAEVVNWLDRAAAGLREAAPTGPRDLAAPQLGAAIDDAVRGLLQCDPIWQIFAAIGLPGEEIPALGAACAVCGERVRVHRQVIPVEGAPRRLQARCDRCGVVSDVAEGSELLYAGFTLDERRLILPDRLRRPPTRVGLRLRTWHRRELVSELLTLPDPVPPPAEIVRSARSAYVLALDALDIVFLRRELGAPQPSAGLPETPAG